MNILITGGASGLGKALTERLLQNSEHHIYFTYSKSAEKANQITQNAKNSTAIQCDFLDTKSVENLLEETEKMDLDVVINNAFTGFEKKHFHKIDPTYFSGSFENNVLPVLKITQKVIKLFKKKKSGKIITILSSAILDNPPIGWSTYVANKNYLLSMSKSWATENIKSNITSNCVSPSFLMTPLNEDVDERIVEKMVEGHPLKKMLTVEEVAETIHYLTTASNQINGVNIVMNAGQHLQ